MANTVREIKNDLSERFNSLNQFLIRQSMLSAQSVAIFIDGNNVDRSLNPAGFDEGLRFINFDSFIPSILNGRPLYKLVYLKEGTVSPRLTQRLRADYNAVIRTNKKSVDAELTLEALSVLDRVSTIVIVSGDSDFIPLVVKAKAMGTTAEVYSVRQTTSQSLIEVCDYHSFISEKDIYVHI